MITQITAFAVSFAARCVRTGRRFVAWIVAASGFTTRSATAATLAVTATTSSTARAVATRVRVGREVVRSSCVVGAHLAARMWRRALRPAWRQIWDPVWGLLDQPVRDAGAWLRHTFPPLAARIMAGLLRRFLQWLPRAVWWALSYAALGAGLAARHTGRYCLAYGDFAARIEHAEHEGQPDRAARLRQRWRTTAARRALIVLLAMATAGVGTDMAVSTHGSRAGWLSLLVLVAALTVIGRIAHPPHDPPTEPDPATGEAGDSTPFPIADAHTRTEAAVAATRALAAEGVELRGTGEVRRTRWGWEVGVMLRRGTPGLITAKTAELETHLDLPAGGVLVTPDRARRAHVTLRFAETDPFATAPAAPHRPPHSASITERAVIGSRIDGLPLDVPLLGVHGVVIGSPGAGKSTTLAAIADAVTACHDAVVWDLDPSGLGLAPLAPAVGRREHERAGIEDALADALALAETRPRLFGQLEMDQAWEPTPSRPAVVVIVDEYPRLSERAKELAVALLRMGRKARVTLILAATEATSDALGASIAELAGLKILHSCRSTDVRLVLGTTMAAEGWRPDRLHPATGDDPGDVGRCYVSTAGLREPIIAKVHPHDAGALATSAGARAVVGIPRIDPQSWHAARAQRTVHPGRPDNSGGRGGGGSSSGDDQVDHQAITDILAAFGGDRRLWTEEIRTRLAERDTDRYGGWTFDEIANALRPLGVSPIQIRLGASNRRGYDRDVIAVAYSDVLGRP